MRNTKTRFSPTDFAALQAKVDAVRKSLLQLSEYMLRANLSHVGGPFYDAAIRRVTDGLCQRLHGVDHLLYEERIRQARAAQEVAVGTGK